MTRKFKVRDLMIQVAPEENQGDTCPILSVCQFPSFTIPPASACTGSSCRGGEEECDERHTFEPHTNCDRPTCNEQPPPLRGAGLDELNPGNLALLQKELRQALGLGLGR